MEFSARIPAVPCDAHPPVTALPRPLLAGTSGVVVGGEMIGRRLPTPARRNGTSAVWDLVREGLAKRSD